MKGAEPRQKTTTSWFSLIFLIIVLVCGTGYVFYLCRGVILSYDEADKSYISSTKSIAKRLVVGDEGNVVFAPSDAIFSYNQPWMYVSGKRPLSKAYSPQELVEVNLPHSEDFGAARLNKHTAQQLSKMFSAAKNDGYSLMVASAYRSVADQQKTYDDFVNAKGVAAAKQYVAQPGSSEHHTGYAVDIDDASPECQTKSDSCTLSYNSIIWLANNAPDFGFIVRYPEGKQPITGSAYEPWHLRYVGIPLAKSLSESEMTFDEFIMQAAPGLIPA